MDNFKLPSAKELKALAAACRKAGITSFKGGGIEFTLAEPKEKAPRRNKIKSEEQKTLEVQGPNGTVKIPAPAAQSEDKIETDGPTYDQLLYWSTGDENNEETVV